MDRQRAAPPETQAKSSRRLAEKLPPKSAKTYFFALIVGLCYQTLIIRSAKADPVHFKTLQGDKKKRGLSECKNKFHGCFASSFSPPRHMTFEREIASKMAKFLSEKSLFETPFKLDRVSFSTPEIIRASTCGACSMLACYIK